MANIIRHIEGASIYCDSEWEAAYRRFESSEQQVRKFIRRYLHFGFSGLDREISIAEIFCGNGAGLIALDQLGFSNLQGVDLSEDLLSQYEGSAEMHLADCRKLPQLDNTLDAVVVHGGLHHLPTLMDDLEAVSTEVARVLKSRGRFYVTEPWNTVYLRLVHAITDQPLIRKCWSRGEAFWEMAVRERETYESWLSRPDEILRTLRQHFHAEVEAIGRGKLRFVGRPHD